MTWHWTIMVPNPARQHVYASQWDNVLNDGGWHFEYQCKYQVMSDYDTVKHEIVFYAVQAYLI